eukprot:gnl/MRDRNA2_/MRDRNA2_147345_c0_seq1.p1 gnl/MRDRNA2_/MRDRNA2_147345_c0~~gnl/MRDRNA2_/MRDRNA2_147345_c0_seq1.p1  ORF type:complete len:628 (-),score=75.14 gnl/MRDRNA2_/MRDRNA2_147345_c0_seq1:106-1989(-)
MVIFWQLIHVFVAGFSAFVCIVWAWCQAQEELRFCAPRVSGASKGALPDSTLTPKWWLKEFFLMLVALLANVAKKVGALAVFVVFCMKICLARRRSLCLVTCVACVAMIVLFMIFIAAWTAYFSRLLVYAGIREHLRITMSPTQNHRNLAFVLTVICSVILMMWLLWDQGMENIVDWIKVALPLLLVLWWIHGAFDSNLKMKWSLILEIPDSSSRQTLNEFLLPGNPELHVNKINVQTPGRCTKIMAATFGEQTSFLLTNWRAVLHRCFPEQPKMRAAHVVAIALTLWVFVLFLGGLWVVFQTLSPRLVWMGSTSAKMVPEFEPDVHHYKVYPEHHDSSWASSIEFSFLPDMQLASNFTFCCNEFCNEVNTSGKINRFAKAIGIDSLLTVSAARNHFGACWLQLDGWRTTVYDITIVALRSLQLLPLDVGQCLHDAAYGCSEYQLKELRTLRASILILDLDAKADFVHLDAIVDLTMCEVHYPFQCWPIQAKPEISFTSLVLQVPLNALKSWRKDFQLNCNLTIAPKYPDNISNHRLMKSRSYFAELRFVSNRTKFEQAAMDVLDATASTYYRTVSRLSKRNESEAYNEGIVNLVQHAFTFLRAHGLFNSSRSLFTHLTNSFNSLAT